VASARKYSSGTRRDDRCSACEPKIPGGSISGGLAPTKFRRSRSTFQNLGRLVLLTNGVAAREPRRISPILAQVATSGSGS
jgi:hypothetical protein